MFPFDYEAWDDTDGDGLTDYIDPNSTAYSYTTVQLCSGGEVWSPTTYAYPGTGTLPTTGYSYTAPVGDYLAVGSSSATGASGYESESCTFTLPAGETLDIVLQTAAYGGEAAVYVTDTTGSTTGYSGFSSYNTYDVVSFTTPGTYTVEYADTYGDGCNPSSYYGVMCYVQASYTYVSGTVAPTVTTYGTSLDYDDDNDGYSCLLYTSPSPRD